VRVALLALAAAVLGCTVNRGIPNGRILCADDKGCPGGYTCHRSAEKMVCCRAGDCTPGGGSGGSGGAAPTDGTGGVPGDGSGGASADAGCSPECAVEQMRCVTGGAQGCVTIAGCLHWGTTMPAPAGACDLQLIDDGIEERDVAPVCAGTLCLIGGITP
jgi:hypothetical protein